MSIISLLPVELLVASGTGAGLAMLLALLVAAIVWNLGTWYLGLPASSSHTLIGAIVGVGLANSMLPGHEFGVGVNWAKAGDVGLALLISPLVGFTVAALLLLRGEAADPRPAIVSSAGRQPAAAAVDPGRADRDVYGGQLRARVERRTKGRRPGDAGADRHRARGLRPQRRYQRPGAGQGDAGDRHGRAGRACAGARGGRGYRGGGAARGAARARGRAGRGADAAGRARRSALDGPPRRAADRVVREEAREAGRLGVREAARGRPAATCAS